MHVPFFDLKIQNQSIRGELDGAIASVLDGGNFIGGDPVTQFENEWASTIGVKHCVGVGNATDGIEIILRAFHIGVGDEVIVPSHTWVSTAEAVVNVGATPVFVDTVDLIYTLDVTKLESCITSKTKAIIPVHMAGRPADMDAIMKIADHYNLKVIEDCAQSHLAKYKERYTGTLGHAAVFSFYPTKNLGAFGDGGAIVTNDDEVALSCRLIANHGQLKRNEHLLHGRNSRLDTLQAAILLVKLKHLQQWTDKRTSHAQLYHRLLDPGFKFTPVDPSMVHVYHLFIIQVDNRGEVIQYLKSKNIETGIHYPTSVPNTQLFSTVISNCKVNDHYANQILSLPIFPELTAAQIEYVCDMLNQMAN